MESIEYIFLSTFYDKEELRQLLILLIEEKLRYKLIDKTTIASSKAPLSAYFEADVLISSIDFERASKIIEEIFP